MWYSIPIMRHWLKKWWWLTVVILAVALVVGWKEKRCQTQAYQCRSKYFAQLGGIPVDQQAAEQEAITAACEPNGYFCRLFSAANLPTMLLVFMGIGGIWAAIETLRHIARQADIMERQTGATERTLVLTQRPRVYVRNFYFSELKGAGGIHHVSNGIENGSFCSGQFYIVNSGGTHAYIKEVYCEVHIAKFLPMMRPYEGKSGEQGTQSLAPGKSCTWLFGRGQPLDSMTAEAIRDNRAGLYVLGWIGYTDDLGIYRIMAFCREYSVAKDRFVPVENPDYEHSD